MPPVGRTHSFSGDEVQRRSVVRAHFAWPGADLPWHGCVAAWDWPARVHYRYRTPHLTTIATGAAVAFFAAFANIDEVIELTNIGTLFAFVLVAIGTLVFRIREPERERPFRTSAIWIVAPGAILSCGFLMVQLPIVTWLRFGAWLMLGIIIYFAYGYRRSRLRHGASLSPTGLAGPAAGPGLDNGAADDHT